jgi:hypothetical protein
MDAEVSLEQAILDDAAPPATFAHRFRPERLRGTTLGQRARRWFVEHAGPLLGWMRRLAWYPESMLITLQG